MIICYNTPHQSKVLRAARACGLRKTKYKTNVLPIKPNQGKKRTCKSITKSKITNSRITDICQNFIIALIMGSLNLAALSFHATARCPRKRSYNFDVRLQNFS
uniref:Uncharacterized protein n=1 Tax=Opuntia streptacantha TaxID=393608 RepID=A0A7C9EDT8_OPUST